MIVVGGAEASGATQAIRAVPEWSWSAKRCVDMSGMVFNEIQARTPEQMLGRTMSLLTSDSLTRPSCDGVDDPPVAGCAQEVAEVEWSVQARGRPEKTRTESRHIQPEEPNGGIVISTPGEHRLVIDHLTKKYGDHAVVDDLTFTVEPGRVTGFLGPNGSASPR